jgi:hypothetical protein
VSIKVKVGGGRSIKAVPRELNTTPIVAPGERKPQIVPDSVVLGIDTIGPYVQRIDGGAGIIVFPEDNIESANIVISHANTSTEVSTDNDILGFTRNVNIDQFGHITQFYNTSLSSLNFTANNTFIQAKDFTIGNTALTIGESTDSITGLTSLIVDDQAIFENATVNNAFIIPVGSTGERPAPSTGMIRYNTSDSRFEGYDGTTWSELAGSVKDVDKDTFIRAESAPGSDNDQLDFFTANTQRLQVDSDGDFKYGDGLNKVVIDYETGDTLFEGRVRANNQVTAASLNVLDLVTTGVVTTGPQGELRSSANLAWDGTNLTIVGGITVDGDFSTSGGLSGDSLSVGNLVANTIIYVSETGALSSNSTLAFDGVTLVVNAASYFSAGVDINSLKVTDLTSGRVVIVGANGELEDSNSLTFDGSTFEVNTQVSVASINVNDLTQNRIVLVGAAGELIDSNKLTWDGSQLSVDGAVDITGDITIDGNITLGNQTVDTINVVAGFISDLVPNSDNIYDIGEIGSNWNTLHVRNISSDIDVVKVTANGAFTVPVGTTSDRPSPLESGMIRFNSTDGVFEGYSGVAWASLGGVKDVDQDTYIQAESSPGADNDELEFYTGGTRRFLVSNTGVIVTDANTDLVFDIGSGIFNVGNSIITGVSAPVNSFDAINKDYLENTYQRNVTFKDGINTRVIALLDNDPTIILDSTLTVSDYDAANNEISIGLKPVWDSFVGQREAGVEGTVPNFDFDVYGRVRSLINIPLAVSSNAVVDFVPSIFGVIEDAVQNGNVEEGIRVSANNESLKLDFFVNNFDIDLTGAVTGSATVVRNSNTAINTTFDFNTLDQRYLNVEGGDTANGALGATKFVDKDDTDYYVDPNSTSRIRNVIIGYGQTESQIQMSTGATSFQYIYATGTKIGYLSNSFNFGTYFDTTNNSWRVEDGSIFSRSFIDSQDNNYFLNPAGNNSRFLGLSIDQSLIIGSNLTVANNNIFTTSGDITINPFSGIIDANTSIISNVSDPVNSLDVVNKQYLDNEISTVTGLIGNITSSGISITAESGNTDVVALGETISFAAGEGINTTVSNNQILIAGELASDTNIGVASFNINNFTVLGGDVTVTTLDGGTF